MYKTTLAHYKLWKKKFFICRYWYIDQYLIQSSTDILDYLICLSSYEWKTEKYAKNTIEISMLDLFLSFDLFKG